MGAKTTKERSCGLKKGVLDRIRDLSRLGWNYTEVIMNLSGIKCDRCEKKVKEFFYANTKVMCRTCFELSNK